MWSASSKRFGSPVEDYTKWIGGWYLFLLGFEKLLIFDGYSYFNDVVATDLFSLGWLTTSVKMILRFSISSTHFANSLSYFFCIFLNSSLSFLYLAT